MTTKLIYCAAAIAMLLAPLALGAQNASMLTAGTRVRLVTPALDAGQRTGKVVGASGDTIQFRADVYPITRNIPLSQITSVEVSRGRVSSKGRFALIGLAVGGAIGFAAGHHESGGRGGQIIGGGRKSASENAFLSAGMVGALGGLTGWLVGRSHTSERWVPAPVSGR